MAKAPMNNQMSITEQQRILSDGRQCLLQSLQLAVLLLSLLIMCRHVRLLSHQLLWLIDYQTQMVHNFRTYSGPAKVDALRWADFKASVGILSELTSVRNWCGPGPCSSSVGGNPPPLTQLNYLPTD